MNTLSYIQRQEKKLAHQTALAKTLTKEDLKSEYARLKNELVELNKQKAEFLRQHQRLISLTNHQKDQIKHYYGAIKIQKKLP
tara:strand:+ start:1019 stop:1267 length:249 start_codon:yes stop_codon:yes gene_type:complete